MDIDVNPGINKGGMHRKHIFLSWVGRKGHNDQTLTFSMKWCAACRVFSRGGDFHARSRFARSAIPEEKWGTTCSLCVVWLSHLTYCGTQSIKENGNHQIDFLGKISTDD